MRGCILHSSDDRIFSSKIKHSTDHYIRICLRCSLRIFSSQIEEKHPKNTQVQKERSSMLKTSKTAGTMYILFALSYKNALRITFDLFVVGNLLYEYRNYETAEICVSLYGTAQMIGFSSRIKHRTDHYICICLSCSLRTFFKIHIEEEQIKNIQVQRSVVQCLKPSKRLAHMYPSFTLYL